MIATGYLFCRFGWRVEIDARKKIYSMLYEKWCLRWALSLHLLTSDIYTAGAGISNHSVLSASLSKRNRCPRKRLNAASNCIRHQDRCFQIDYWLSGPTIGSHLRVQAVRTVHYIFYKSASTLCQSGVQLVIGWARDVWGQLVYRSRP